MSNAIAATKNSRRKSTNLKLPKQKNTRLGRFNDIPAINKISKSKVKTLRENSLQTVGPRLFNSLPQKLWNLTRCTMEE